MRLATDIKAADEYTRRVMRGNRMLCDGDVSLARLEFSCASAYLNGVMDADPDAGAICRDAADAEAKRVYGDVPMFAGQLTEPAYA